MGYFGINFGNNWDKPIAIIEAPPIGSQAVEIQPSTLTVPEILKFVVQATIPRREIFQTRITISVKFIEKITRTNQTILRRESIQAQTTASFIRLELTPIQETKASMKSYEATPQYKIRLKFTFNMIKNMITKDIKKKDLVVAGAKLAIKGSLKKGTARIIATATNKKIQKIQDDCQTRLENLATDFIKSKEPIIQLLAKHGDELLQYIIGCSTKAYAAGFDYIEIVTGQKIKLTDADEIKIKKLAKDSFDSFWNTIRRAREEKERQEKNLPSTIKQAIKGASAFDFVKVLIAALMTNSVNQGTLSSAQSLDQFNTDQIFNANKTNAEPLYEFVTMRDDRVDQDICAKLDGILMRPSDTIFAVPPLHYGCRCRLLLRLEGETLSN